MSPLAATAVAQTMDALCVVTQGLPIGTNLALFHFLWMQISGALLPARGALFPGLQVIGLLPPAIRRAWAAFRYGAWQTAGLLSVWEGYVTAQGQWQEHHYAGYRPKAVDITAYWRPTLRGLRTKHYYPPERAGLPRYVVRLAANFTARRNVLPPYTEDAQQSMAHWCVRWLARGKGGSFQPPLPTG